MLDVVVRIVVVGVVGVPPRRGDVTLDSAGDENPLPLLPRPHGP